MQDSSESPTEDISLKIVPEEVSWIDSGMGDCQPASDCPSDNHSDSEGSVTGDEMDQEKDRKEDNSSRANAEGHKRMEEWIALIRNERTRQTAISCLVYIGNAFEQVCDHSHFKNDRDTFVHYLKEIIVGASFVKEQQIGMQEYLLSHFKYAEHKPEWRKTCRSEISTTIFDGVQSFLNDPKDGYSEDIAVFLMNAIASIYHDFYTANASPLHEAARSHDLDATVILLSHGVDVNALDVFDHTALHYAVEDNFVLVAKALLLFGADPTLASFNVGRVVDLNDLSGEMEQVIEIVRERPVLEANSSEDETKAEKNPPNIANLLSLDGGGIRGLITITILSEIESIIPGFCSKFNFIAGTSTGAILALAIAQGKSIAECRRLYFKLKDHVFKKGDFEMYYDEKVLESFLRMSYGEETLEELWIRTRKRVIVTANSMHGKVARLALFKSYIHREELDIGGKDNDDKTLSLRNVCVTKDEVLFGFSKERPNPRTTKLHHAARASSAAPLHFKSFKGYVDGGIGFNNPSMVLHDQFTLYNELLKERIEKNPEGTIFPDGELPMKLGVFLNVGTGEFPDAEPQTANRDVVRQFFSDTFNYVFANINNEFQNVLKFAERDIATDDDSFKLLARKLRKENFFRLSPKLEKEVLLDETNNQTLIEMMWLTKIYMHENFHNKSISEMMKKVFNS